MKKETLVKKARQKYWFYSDWIFSIYWNDGDRSLIPQLEKLTHHYIKLIRDNGGSIFE